MKNFQLQTVEKVIPAVVSELLAVSMGVLLAVSPSVWGGAAEKVPSPNGYGTLVSASGESPFVAVAEKMLPAVVYIESTSELDLSFMSEGGGGFGGIPDDETHRGLPGATSSGSGVIVSADGLILTNYHVVNGASEIAVFLSNEERLDAKVLGLDPETDLAVLKVERRFGKDRIAVFGDSDQLKIGDWAIALGNPYGLQQSLTVGVISAKGRSDLNISGGAPVFQDFIQTDASINLGNSGGPLANIHGELIGINTAINAIGQGIGFAIPINMARRVYEQLSREGRVVRGYLGMSPGPLELEQLDALKLPAGTRGVLVLSVESGSPASRGDLQARDVITEWNGMPLHDVADFRMKVAAVIPGERATARVLRKGQSKDLEFVMDDRADHVVVAATPSGRERFGTPRQRAPRERTAPESRNDDPLVTSLIQGVKLQAATRELREHYGIADLEEAASKGVIITGFEDTSPLRRQLRTGDLIYKVDRYRIDSPEDYRRALSLLEGREGATLYHIIRGERSTILPVLP